MPVITVGTILTQEFVNMALAMVGLIVLDLLFGVALAVRTGSFEWSKLSNFYRTTVVPNLIGWFGVHVVISLAAALAVSALIDFLKPVLDVGFYGLVMASLLAQVVSKGKEISSPMPSPVQSVSKENK